LALDEPKENDEVFEKEGITFLVEKSLKKYLKKVTVDYNEGGFRPGFSITPVWSEQDLFTGTCSI
jgi:Fe-S cluster assembly iron-binding protein IscA